MDSPPRAPCVRTRGSCLKTSRLALFTMLALVLLSIVISKGDPSTMYVLKISMNNAKFVASLAVVAYTESLKAQTAFKNRIDCMRERYGTVIANKHRNEGGKSTEGWGGGVAFAHERQYREAEQRPNVNWNGTAVPLERHKQNDAPFPPSLSSSLPHSLPSSPQLSNSYVD